MNSQVELELSPRLLQKIQRLVDGGGSKISVIFLKRPDAIIWSGIPMRCGSSTSSTK